eukprot:CAMPEP_0174236654 /NCGR_PEP_ID=MMETSP0417-20130205/5719_1 /TAXON_ID=242541 /ORGANISM="Mayorella sp, Strain BSH-02190019" /LENGTH=166 /DNA_ID=CAMNT_0015315325 /DNA_START=42 /DNA_END=542 /DNA_ORIENTATION=+
MFARLSLLRPTLSTVPACSVRAYGMRHTDKVVLESAAAPAAIGPYSQAILVPSSGQVHVSGCLGLDPKSGELVSANVAEQAARALENMQAVLQEADCSMADVVKCTVLLRSMDDFGAVNEVYSRYFSTQSGAEAAPAAFPARICYAVSGLPKNALVEIDAIAQQPK